MKIYMFQADLYCKPCGESITATLPEPTEFEREYPDSESHPIAVDSSEGASDSPDHCGNHECELFLERNLTEDGIEYVKEAVEELKFGHGRSDIVQQWSEFYI